MSKTIMSRLCSQVHRLNVWHISHCHRHSEVALEVGLVCACYAFAFVSLITLTIFCQWFIVTCGRILKVLKFATQRYLSSAEAGLG